MPLPPPKLRAFGLDVEGKRAAAVTGGADGAQGEGQGAGGPGERRRWQVGDFNFGKSVGKGRFGSVFLCQCKASKKLVAVKVLFKDQLKAHGITHQIRNEVGRHGHLPFRTGVGAGDDRF
jgi:hypothetical protein